MRRRRYNVQCIENSEFLLLFLNDIDKMKREFASISKEFFKRQMQQTKQFISLHLHMLKQTGSGRLEPTNTGIQLLNESSYNSTDLGSIL
jgi:hypothetical protein